MKICDSPLSPEFEFDLKPAPLNLGGEHEFVIEFANCENPDEAASAMLPTIAPGAWFDTRHMTVSVTSDPIREDYDGGVRYRFRGRVTAVEEVA